MAIPRSLLALALLTGCGGGSGSPNAPSGVPAPVPTPGLQQGSVLTIARLPGAGPVSGAEVTINGQSASGPFTATYVSDGAGRVVLDRGLSLHSPALLDVVKAGFLPRNTTLRSASDIRIDVFASDGPASQGLVASLVYSQSSCPAEENPTLPLRRLPRGSATLVIDGAIADGVVVDRHVEAAARFSSVQQVPLFVTHGGSPSGFRIDIAVDPDDPVCEANIIGVARTTTAASGDIATARIVYCQSRWARDLNTVVHETGHVLGLRHSPNRSDVMYCYADRGVETPSLAETAILSFLDARRSGTRFPDNDRDARGTSLAGSQQTICHAGPR